MNTQEFKGGSFITKPPGRETALESVVIIGTWRSRAMLSLKLPTHLRRAYGFVRAVKKSIDW
jgi:hypothetical protein